MFYTCGPNAALVKSGAFVKKPVIVSGGFVHALPCVQRVQKLDLRVMTLDVYSPQVYTKQGVPITVRSIAQVKINREAKALEIAAGQFLGMSREQVARAADETLEGHQRAILGSLTVEEVFQDREKFAEEVLETATVDVASMGKDDLEKNTCLVPPSSWITQVHYFWDYIGSERASREPVVEFAAGDRLEIVSFTIRDVSDDNGYLSSLGKKRTAEVKRDARIGEAEAERDAGVREAQANREKLAKRAEAETAIADAQRKFQLQQAQIDFEVNTEKAKAEMAGELQKAKTRQDIKKEAMEVEVVVRRKKIEVEEQEIARRGKELDATVKRPAEAERYRIEQEAEGQRAAKILVADGSAKGTILKGDAEADVIRMMGEAEAEAMQAKAEAWKEYTAGAYLESLISKLPLMAAQVAEPLSQAKEVTLISTGGPDVGASRLTGEVVRVMAQVPPVIKQLTGIDMATALHRLQPTLVSQAAPETTK